MRPIHHLLTALTLLGSTVLLAGAGQDPPRFAVQPNEVFKLQADKLNLPAPKVGEEYRFSLCLGRVLGPKEVSKPCYPSDAKPRVINAHNAPIVFQQAPGTFLPAGLAIDGDGVLHGKTTEQLKDKDLQICAIQLNESSCAPLKLHGGMGGGAQAAIYGGILAGSYLLGRELGKLRNQSNGGGGGGGGGSCKVTVTNATGSCNPPSQTNNNRNCTITLQATFTNCSVSPGDSIHAMTSPVAFNGNATLASGSTSFTLTRTTFGAGGEGCPGTQTLVSFYRNADGVIFVEASVAISVACSDPLRPTGCQ